MGSVSRQRVGGAHSLEAEVGKGLPVSLIGHHLLVDQVHLDIVQSFQIVLNPNQRNSSNLLKGFRCENVFSFEKYILVPATIRFRNKVDYSWHKKVKVLYRVFFEKWSFFQALLLLNSEVEGIQSSSVAYLIYVHMVNLSRYMIPDIRAW